MATALERFIDAQRGVWPAARAEIRAGRKASHWMWFIFPQIAGLGHSAMARRYAIIDLAEARAYLAHDILGPRLHEATATMLHHVGASPEDILGPVDALKLRSSMTLFEAAADDPGLFTDCLDAFYGGMRDPRTLARLW